MGLVLLIVLIILLFGAFPREGAYNASWGPGPSGLLGLVLIIVLILLLLGYIPRGF